MVDEKTGFRLGDEIRIRRHAYTVVGLTRRMVSSGGDPMVFIGLRDAQEAQFLKDNDAILNDRARTAANPALNRPGVPGLLDAVQAAQSANRNVNAVLVQLQPAMIRSRWQSRSGAGNTWRSIPARRWRRSWWPS